jgi:uncharacterized protein YvpB
MEKTRNELELLNNRFIWLYRQKRYPEAIREAEKGLELSKELPYLYQPYRNIFKNNIQAANLKFKKAAVKSDAGLQRGALPRAKKNFGRKFILRGLLLAVCMFCALFIFSFMVLPCGPGQDGSRDGSKESCSSVFQSVADAEGLPCLDAAARDRFVANPHELKESILIEAPHIRQNPELPRGCEVASLAMLLQHAGVAVDKMTLAREIVKEPALYRDINGNTFFGNPYRGFVGDMYSRAEPGYGVYHGPIKKLMDKYLPGQTIDLTGCDFKDIKVFLSYNVPVWVVANTTYAELDASRFETWRTSEGVVQITYLEHAVLLTGYDQDYIYFNDPLRGSPNRKAAKDSFRAAWEQMGKQAVSYLPF